MNQRLWTLGATLGACALLACGRGNEPEERADSENGDSGENGEPSVDDVSFDGLLGAPLIHTPTRTSFGVSAAVDGRGAPTLRAWFRKKDSSAWSGPLVPAHPADDIAAWTLTDLEPGTEYEYVLAAAEPVGGEAGVEPPEDREAAVYAGRAVTQREPGDEYSFVLVTDTHIAPRVVRSGELSAANPQEQVLLALAPDIAADEPDFIVNLGDMLDYHDLGFNPPLPNESWSRLAYLNYRRCFRDALGNAAHFPVLGNWDGENGSFTEEQIGFARDPRRLYVPAPGSDTYPEGGSAHEDYYAFTWGDALFVALNVMSYTEERLLLDGVGSPEAWTLGSEQLAWLEQTLESATSKWRFLMIHHTVGGSAGNVANSIYGRGGGLAANVGEQAFIHDLMYRHGVQVFFYGHDHVFTDIVVDGIHYTLPGSAGAPWKFTPEQTGYTDYWPDSGYGRVRVSPEAVHVEFVSAHGLVLHDYMLE